jgi:hypothetical protein
LLTRGESGDPQAVLGATVDAGAVPTFIPKTTPLSGNRARSVRDAARLEIGDYKGAAPPDGRNPL